MVEFVPIVSHRALVLGATVACAAVAFALHETAMYSGSRDDAPAPLSPSDPLHPAPPSPMRGLPPLARSDAAIRDALRKAGGAEALMRALAPEGLIRRFVATVDRSTGASLPSRLYPLTPPDDLTKHVSGLQHAVLDERHFARYDPYVRMLESLDTKRLVALYARVYPLLQQAYGELEAGGGYFNDKLVQAIDDVLRAPEPAMPIRLVDAGAHYRFEDPRLEACSGGQKALIRMGPAHAARVKAKLREIRKLLGLRGPPAAPGED